MTLTRIHIVTAIALILVGVTVAIVAWHRSPLVVTALRVHDIAPESPTPKLLLAVIFQNPGPDPVAIHGRVELNVRTVNTGGEQHIRPDRGSDDAITVPPRGSVEVVYELWQLANIYESGYFRDVRDSPDDMRFRLEVETDSGDVRSDEWSGVSAGTDVGVLLRELRGGDEI